jgi:hypothetical protein
MKIDASSISLAAAHNASSRVDVQETMRAWIGDKRPDFEHAHSADGTNVSFSPGALLAFLSELPPVAPAPAPAAPPAKPARQANAIDDAMDAADHDPTLRLLKLILEMLTGTKIKSLSAEDVRALNAQAQADNSALQQAAQAQQAEQGQSQAPPPRAGFGIEYDRHEVHAESERTQFNATGVVHTSDGKTIEFSVALDMQRSHTEESNVSLRAGDAVRKDPLVINFDGAAAQLQSTRFAFDLDGDGKKEDVPLLSGNRGYLALDLDRNGKIDSGRELFGASSGDGFADLARYDADRNGWIDENDAVFNRLKVWSPAGDGAGSLTSLQDKGVGALYLGSAQTPFALKDGANADLGAVRASGVYLREDGSAGTLQQIDVTV